MNIICNIRKYYTLAKYYANSANPLKRISKHFGNIKQRTIHAKCTRKPSRAKLIEYRNRHVHLCQQIAYTSNFAR